MSSTQPPVSPGIADLCFRFQSAFDSGQCPGIEVFLQETPPEERRAALRALLEVEWACRRKRGESIDDEEYGRRFPQQAGSIREWIYATDVPVNRSPRVVGIELPGYEIIRELGRGGMGVVFEALDSRLKRHVAVKMILSADLADSQELERFQREAEVTARLAHEGVVQIHHVGSHQGRPFLVMELVEGGSLASKLRGKPVPAKQVATIASQLARAVDAAHTAGIIHRDLKPGNIFVGAGWKLKVGDFGLARRLDEPGQTRTGAVLGTPAYMAPEQAMGRKDIGLTADVWSLGAITYELLTGKPPFTGGSMMDILEAVIHRDPRHPSAINPKANADLSVIALKCLEKDPNRRYASAGDLAEDLERFLRHEPIRARPAGMMERLWKNVRRAPSRAGLIGLAMLAVVLLVLGGYFARQANWLQGLKTSLTETRNAETEQRRLEDEQRLSDEAEAARRIAESNRRAAYELDLLRQGVQWACAPDEARQRLEDPAICPVDLRDVRHQRLLTLCRRPATLIPEPTPLTESARAAMAGSGVFLSPDGKVMARGTFPPAARVARHMGNQEFHLELVDLETGRVLHRLGTFPNQSQLDNQVAFSADGRTLAMAIPPKPGGFGGGNAFGPDKQWEVQLWDVATGKEGNRFPLVAGACQRLAFRPGSTELVVLSTDSTRGVDLLELRKKGLFGQAPSRLTLYDTRTGDDRKLSGKDDQQITLIEFSADGSRMVTAGQRVDDERKSTGTFAVYDMKTREKILDGRDTDTQQAYTAIAISPDGKTIAYPAKGIQLLDVKTRKLGPTLEFERETFGGISSNVPQYGTTHLMFDRQGKRLAVGNVMGAVKVFDLPAGKQSLSYGHQGAIKSLVFTPNGEELLSAATTTGVSPFGGVNSQLPVRRRNLKSGKERNVLAKPRNIRCIVASPDGKTIAAGTEEWSDGRLLGCIQLFDVSGKELAIREAHAGGVRGLAYSPDGKRLASCGLAKAQTDGFTQSALSGFSSSEIKVWPVDPLGFAGAPTVVGQLEMRLGQRNNIITALTFDSSGTNLAYATDSGVYLWDFAKRESTALISESALSSFEPTQRVHTLTFSQDGRLLAAGGAGREQSIKAIGPQETTGGEIRLIDTRAKRELLTFKGHTRAVHWLAFAEDGRTLASAGSSGEPGSAVERREWDTGKVVDRLNATKP